MKIPTKVTTLVGKGVFKVKKCSPEILIGLGIAGVVGTVILAYKAPFKCEEVIAQKEELEAKIEEAKNKAEEGLYTETDVQNDLRVIKSRTIIGYTKVFAPIVILGVSSIMCFLGAYGIVKARHAAVLSAYNILQTSFDGYRERVKAEFGEKTEYRLLHDLKEEIVEGTMVDEKGKTKKIEKINYVPGDNGMSMYARVFGKEGYIDGRTWEGSTQFSTVHNYNYLFLRQKLNWANDRLKAYGHIFLNEIYEELGFPKTQAGQVVGWLYDGTGDNYVSFGPFVDSLSFKDGDPIALDFNVDGIIWEQI